MPQTQDIPMPRWALPLGETTWRQINEMLDDGHANLDIVRELSIPDSKVRSLQDYARKFGPRRRLIRFGAFKDALLSGAGEFGEDVAKAMGRIAFLSISGKTKPALQVRAAEAMNGYVKTLGKLMEADAKAEEKRRAEDGDTKRVEASEVANEILDIYGAPRDGDRVRDGGGDDDTGDGDE